MRTKFLLIAVIFLAGLFFPMIEVDAGENKIDVVNIETYVQITIDFFDGDSLHLEADITAQPYPVSVILIKGEDSFNDWIESETVDVEAIKNGSQPQNRTDTFVVIENFSKKNITEFSPSIDIGEHDTYYLIIALYRESGMDINDLLGRATEVNYAVDWEVESKELNVTLIIIAVVSFFIGLVFLVLYFISRARAMEEGEIEENEDPGEKKRQPSIDTRRRSPPLR
jgi:hypothetical protein